MVGSGVSTQPELWKLAYPHGKVSVQYGLQNGQTIFQPALNINS